MTNGRMYITLNRSREWRRSLLVNLRIREHQLVFSDQREGEQGMLAAGVLITGSIDSTEQDFSWDNLRIDARLPGNSVIKVACYASDSKEVLLGDKTADLDEAILAAREDAFNSARELSPLFRQIFSGAPDGLLQAHGRYLWLRLEFLVPQPELFCLRGIRLLRTNEKILRYLPEIYRDNPEADSFFPRFMEIFDSIFFDIEESVNRLPQTLDYRLAGGELLRFLSGWVCIQDPGGRTDEELREQIGTLLPEYPRIGTKPGIERFVEQELGVKPVIVEYFNYKQMLFEGRDTELFRELFGTNPYKFFILLPEEAFGQQKISSFLGKLKHNIPAHTEVEIILLKKGVILGRHTYLGVNSMVGEYNYVSVDENIAISYDTLIGGSIDEE